MSETLRERMEREDETAWAERQRRQAEEGEQRVAAAALPQAERRHAELTRCAAIYREVDQQLDARIAAAQTAQRAGTPTAEDIGLLIQAKAVLAAGTMMVGPLSATPTLLVEMLVAAGLTPLYGRLDPLVGRPGAQGAERQLAEVAAEVADLKRRARLL